MDSTEIFNRHLRSGFDLGWHRDIPRFTPEDWEQFLSLAYKIWELAGPERQHYYEIRSSIPPEFWENISGNHHLAVRNIVSPLGKIYFHPKWECAERPDLFARAQKMPVLDFGPRPKLQHMSGLSEIINHAFDSKWDDETRKRFLAGLEKAKSDPLAGAALAELEMFWLEPVCERRGLIRETEPSLNPT